VVAVVLALVLPANSDGPGPLGNGGSPGGVCAPIAYAHPLTMGITVLKNSGSAPATITSVTLANPHDLTMLKPFVTPWDGPLLGVRPYPPTGPDTQSWALRKPAVGSAIAPHGAKALVFGVLPTGHSTGRSRGAKVEYSAGGNSYTYQDRTSFEVRVKPARCF
jgi:hypothetical protein